MQILSKNKRTLYLIVLLIIFIVGSPILVLYSLGYRFGANFLVKTGGVTIRVIEPNVSIFINGEKKRESNFFQKTYFFQNIKPGQYSIRTEKDGKFTWETKVEVFPEYVTEVYPFLIAEKIQTEDIQNIIKSSGSGAGTDSINPEYARLLKKFDSVNHFEKSKHVKAYKNLAAELWNDNIVIVWNGKEDLSPHYFCGFLECGRKIAIPLLTKDVIDFDFYPYRDDVFLVLRGDGLYALSIDGQRNIQWFPFYIKSGIKFFIEEKDLIYIKDGDEIKKIVI